MNEIVELFKNVRLIPGAAAKAAFLKEHRSPLLDQIIADAMDPGVTYGVTSKDVIPSDSSLDVGPDWYAPFHDLLQRLAKRELTGGAAIEAISASVAARSDLSPVSARRMPSALRSRRVSCFSR